MASWQEQAYKALENSLYPVPQELNGVDWKCALSDKSEKLAHHLCAFSNTTGGGFLAQMMLLLHMCERRGSGIDRATDAIGEMKLPAYKAQSGDDYTRITLYPKKKVSEMTREERIAVCYQHACLLYEDGMAIGNQSVRERFNINTKQSAMASRILADTLESGLIKMENPETESKRYTSYIPFYG